MKKLSFVSALLLVISPIGAVAQDAAMHPMDTTDKGTNPATQAYMQAMHTMHQKTQSMTSTNDASKDFVIMMKPHHQAAVDMAQAYLKYGHDPVLVKMSKDIITSQKHEIAVMNDWEAKHGIEGR